MSKSTLRILLVENEKDHVYLIQCFCSMWEINILLDVAMDDVEAKVKIKGNEYDVVLMDVRLGIVDGRELTQHIRREIMVETPIIAVTAYASSEDRLKCLESGMNDYMSKPVDHEGLKEKILEWVR